MAFELCSFDDIKNTLGLTKNAIAEYPALEVLKSSVEQAIEDHLGRLLESVERTESIYTGPEGTRMITLKALPVATVAEVILTDAEGVQDTLVSTDYRITPYGIRLDSLWKDIDVSVKYTGGYADDAVPSNINRAALMQTVYEFQNKEHIGASSVQNEGGSVTIPELSLLKEVVRLLNASIHPLKTTFA